MVDEQRDEPLVVATGAAIKLSDQIALAPSQPIGTGQLQTSRSGEFEPAVTCLSNGPSWRRINGYQRRRRSTASARQTNSRDSTVESTAGDGGAVFQSSPIRDGCSRSHAIDHAPDDERNATAVLKSTVAQSKELSGGNSTRQDGTRSGNRVIDSAPGHGSIGQHSQADVGERQREQNRLENRDLEKDCAATEP